MVIIFGLLLLAGAVLLYLSHSHQRWLANPLSAWPSRVAGCLLLLAGLYCALLAFSVVTAIFATLVLLMLYWGLLPFIALTPLVPQRADEKSRRQKNVRN
ncbi:MAG: hypothetical protein AAGC78_02530 [Cellvibrio sp.]|uniref:hypothetical protein n=1 Tax=Cellvibrio sp. TaxID=1965322 RepID=UPI0031A97490